MEHFPGSHMSLDNLELLDAIVHLVHTFHVFVWRADLGFLHVSSSRKGLVNA